MAMGVRLGLPAINVSGRMNDLTLPRVLPDHRAMGRMAAEHLLETGLKAFAFIGPGGQYIYDRRDGFIERLREEGFSVEVGRWSPPGEMLSWLKALHKPIGIMAGNDESARKLEEVILAGGLSIPHDLALMGADNDELACMSSLIPISSVAVQAEEVGRKAAQQLGHLMKGHPVSQHTLLVTPGPVVERESTQAVHFSESALRDALAYIRKHACGPLDVNAVAAAVKVARRTLERLFRENLRRSLHDEIQRVRLEQAKHLLAKTALPIKTIASKTGFFDANHLNRIFQAALKTTPSAFREKNREEGP
jgi:LacI family transcriptional regulator